MIVDRSGIIVWVNDIKAARNLERFGSVHYISKKMHYVAMYVYSSKVDETIRNIQKLPYVKKVEPSYRNEIKTEYSSNGPDKNKSFTL
ncbi:YlbG family protein [Paenibacillus sp. GP183]|jgi:uncharacterized protein YlbG (UPF0298 family)|uniref:YlbG family protein n=1 Tax=Paenibacillus sp. GP183 TaxID=1882751 RepID=UPI0008998605|nr:YlbG family protein [Paenibacillus sp. GP183]SEB44206.1 Uncharacterized protein YlbG, UPF0298 family [Paenibacillus sp. GP183]